MTEFFTAGILGTVEIILTEECTFDSTLAVNSADSTLPSVMSSQEQVPYDDP